MTRFSIPMFRDGKVSEHIVWTIFSSKFIHVSTMIFLICAALSFQVSRMFTFCLLSLELMHALLHFKVLFAVGKNFETEEYEDNRSYFMFDGVTSTVAYYYVSQYHKLPWWASLFLVMNWIVHAVYVIKWKWEQSDAPKVILWSSLDFEKRSQTFDFLTHCRFFVGTFFDLSVHVALTSYLFSLLV